MLARAHRGSTSQYRTHCHRSFDWQSSQHFVWRPSSKASRLFRWRLCLWSNGWQRDGQARRRFSSQVSEGVSLLWWHRRSFKGELLIAEWLSAQRVYYDYERLANIPEHLVPDFTVYADDGHPVFMELWGMLDNPDYQQRRLRKCEVYHRHRCQLIELYNDDLRNLDFCLRAKLKAHNVSFT